MTSSPLQAAGNPVDCQGIYIIPRAVYPCPRGVEMNRPGNKK